MATPRSLVLASASPARLRLLREAGFDPVVRVSGVDEAAVREDDPWVLVRELATRKAAAVAESYGDKDALVVGCDSMLVLDGDVLGKPADAAEATERWRRMRGRTGVLLTGHCVTDVGSGRVATEVADTVVRFGNPNDDEIAAYVATGEPLHVAGAFTIDGRSSVFIDGVDGDPSNVVGLSLPLLRRLLAELGVAVTSLWR
ncbi:MAG: septum formation inhibitor Maf [Frankiaceae bacterium]|nr:septum formation inhibitor Maf [Frankiaceae bacterium]MBV9369979.1 septum formation inhibitor Maf [Frankiales bacterium]